MQRVRLPAEQRRQDILDHAAHLFTEHGFEAVSMGTIAQAIGTSRPNVYTYFPDLVSVLRVLLDRRLSDLEAELTPQLAPGAPLDLSALWDTLGQHRQTLLLLHCAGDPVLRAERERFDVLVSGLLRDVPEERRALMSSLVRGLVYETLVQGRPAEHALTELAILLRPAAN